jgi:hypothetical protein
VLFCRHYLSPLQNYCCFIHSSETHFLTDVVLFTLSQYLDLLVWFLSIQFNHLVLVVLFCLLSHWCCLVYQSKPLVSLLLFYLAFRSTLRYWCCFIYPFEAPWGTGVVLSTLSKHLGVLVLFCLLSQWFCRFSSSGFLLSSLWKYFICMVQFYLP